MVGRQDKISLPVNAADSVKIDKFVELDTGHLSVLDSPEQLPNWYWRNNICYTVGMSKKDDKKLIVDMVSEADSLFGSWCTRL